MGPPARPLEARALPKGSIPVDRPAMKPEAVVMRVTPALLDALRAAKASGVRATVRFGAGQSGNIIRIGEATFAFSCVPEGRCDILTVPASGSGVRPATAVVTASATRKAIVARNVADERARVRARAVAAEQAGVSRKAQLLDAGGGGGGGAVAARMARRPQPVGAAVRAGSSGPAGAAPRMVVGRSAVKLSVGGSRASLPAISGLRGTSPTPGRASSAPPTRGASAAPVMPARSLRDAEPSPALAARETSPTLIPSAAPTQRPPSQPRAAPSTPPVSDTVVRAAQHGGLRGCLLALLAERPCSLPAVRAVVTAAGRRVPGLTPSSSSALEWTLKSVATFAPPGKYVLNPSLRAEAERLVELPAPSSLSGRQGSGLSGAPACASASRSGEEGTAVLAPRKRPRVEGNTGSAAAGSVSGASPSISTEEVSAPRRTRSVPLEAASSEVPARRAAASGSSDSAGLSPARTSSSEASWVGELAGRKPVPAAPVTTPDEYASLEANFNEKYERYFSLHRTLEAHRGDVEAWREAFADPGLAPPARRDLERRLAEAWRRRRARIERADAAFRVLHTELADAKARLGEFIASVERQADPVRPSAAPHVVAA